MTLIVKTGPAGMAAPIGQLEAAGKRYVILTRSFRGFRFLPHGIIETANGMTFKIGDEIIAECRDEVLSGEAGDLNVHWRDRAAEKDDDRTGYVTYDAAVDQWLQIIDDTPLPTITPPSTPPVKPESYPEWIAVALTYAGRGNVLNNDGTVTHCGKWLHDKRCAFDITVDGVRWWSSGGKKRIVYAHNKMMNTYGSFIHYKDSWYVAQALDPQPSRYANLIPNIYGVLAFITFFVFFPVGFLFFWLFEKTYKPFFWWRRESVIPDLFPGLEEK